MNQDDFAQANIDAAHSLEERFHRTWEQLWEDAGLFANKGWAREFRQVIDAERPFLCVHDGKPMSYEELLYSRAISDKDGLTSIICYPCKQREAAKNAIGAFAHGRKEAA